MYKVIGSDGQEYQASSVAELKKWIAEGCVCGETLVKGSESAQWKKASECAELSDCLARRTPPQISTPPPIPCAIPDQRVDPHQGAPGGVARKPKGHPIMLAIGTLVVGLLVLSLVEAYSAYAKKKNARISATRTSIQAVLTAIDLYEVDQGVYPSSLKNLLMKSTESNWNGPYIINRGMRLTDAWDNELQYRVRGTEREIRSAGPDGVYETRDDIVY